MRDARAPRDAKAPALTTKQYRERDQFYRGYGGETVLAAPKTIAGVTPAKLRDSYLKDRKDSYVFAQCPYSPTQLKFILSNLRRIAANFDSINQCIDKKSNLPKETRHLKDDESGQYFAKETRFIERIDFMNFNEVYKEQYMLAENGENIV